MKAELEARAAVINGKEITIPARANEEGHLYGSIGPAQIAHALEEINVPVSPDEIMLAHSIQQLDKYEVTVELEDDITATVSVWVVPIREPRARSRRMHPRSRWNRASCTCLARSASQPHLISRR